jgi:hypothetical protein
MTTNSEKQVKQNRIVGCLVVLGATTVLGWLTLSRYILAWTTDTFGPRPLHPSYASLQAHGFYVFVLPQSAIEQRGWQQSIALWSWNIHCGLLRGDTTNPLQVVYTDPSGKRVFEVWHGPWGVVWNYALPTNRMEVESRLAWNTTGTLTYYTQTRTDSSLRHLYRFEDMTGNAVEITSQLVVTETLELIEQLEYIGPPTEGLGNPWNCP